MRLTLSLLLALLVPVLMMGQNPVADFSANVTSGCSPVTVTFKDLSTGSPTSWNWDFGGQLSTQQNPSFSFPAGTYTITLTVRNSNGVSSVTKTNFIVSNPSPTADFIADRTITCLPTGIQFTDKSVANAGTITKWEWGFDDLVLSSAQNPSHTYAAPGYYTIYLAVTNSAGCKSATTKGRYIRILNGVKANFDYTGPTTCAPPFVLSYKNLTSGPGNLSYAWDLGNGNTSTAVAPPATYPTAGNYTVKLKAQSDYGCSDSIQKTISPKGISTTFTAPASVCLGSAATFQSTSTPTPVKVLWKFSDGTTSNTPTVSKTFTSAGNYTVTLYSTFANCSDSLTKPFIVADKPPVSLSISKNNACKPPHTVTLQNTSPDAVSSAWDFGDGTTGTGSPVTHTYTNIGNYNVSLTITDSKGCTNKLTYNDYVLVFPPNPQLQNVPAGLCVGQSFSPTVQDLSVDGIATYSWDFGDGTPLNTAANPSHSYATLGFKTLKLTVVTNGGCSVTVSATIQVGTPPIVAFSADKVNPCHSDVVTFTNSSTPVSGSVALWNFNDGTVPSTAFNPPAHKFADTGLYTIKLKVTHDGCADSLSKTDFIHVLPPVANFGYKIPDCNVKTTVSFIDSSQNNAAAYGPLVYQWSFGDPAAIPPTSILPNPIVNYSAIATYNVKLIVNNSFCFDTIIKPVRLYNTPPTFTIDKPTYCRNERVALISTNDLSFIKKFIWVVDGVADTTDQLGHPVSFAVTGTHTAKLVTQDINGCFDSSAAKTFTVTGPTALFTIGNHGGCNNSVVTFNDASTVSASNVLTKWIFDFGDGSSKTFTAAPFTHTYADTGHYTVKMTVFDNGGCFDTLTLTGNAGAVITRPVPNFGTDQTTFCPNTSLQFTDSSAGNKLTYAWSFGDGTTDNAQNPVHLYTGKDSVYTVKLTVTDSVGCADSLVRNNYISIRSPKPLYTVKDTITLCPPLETKFFYAGKDAASFYWDFGDGSPQSSLDTTSHFYANYGQYTAKLFAYGFGGCADSASININVVFPRAFTTVTFDPQSACNQALVTFNVTHPFGTSFQIFFGDGFVSDTSQNPTLQHLYGPGFPEPAILLRDSTGCETFFGGFGNVDIRGAIPIFGKDKKEFCDSGTVSFIDYSQEGRDPIVSKSWDFGDGTTNSTGGSILHTYKQAGLYAPTLTVNTAAGCTNSFIDTVRVLATPKPLITSVDGVCNNIVIDFKGSLLLPPDTAISWKWDLSKGQTSVQQNVSVNYPDTGLHHIMLTATNSLGCKGDTSKDIIVYPLPAITVAGDTTIIAGAGGITIPLTYSTNATTFNWTPATNLSCTDCANPFATPKFTTSYNVKVTDANGCISSRNVTLVVVCNNKNFFIPNTFSPNNDGANDQFYPRGTGLDRIQALRIFNRWGELVFEKRNFPANDAASGWDGNYKGKTAPSDTYIYMIDIICENATIITYKGNITLIR